MQKRYDFVFLFDVADGNPNGDPDAGNLPRVDPETGHGLVTDVCLKRKVRNFVGTVHEEKPPYEIYVKEGAVLNSQHSRAYEAIGKKSGKGPDADATAWMCKNFYDVRAFGAVMSTDVNCGQVRGPIQLTFSRSLQPIVALEHAVTRCAVTNERDAKDGGDNRTMGRKFTVPYGLYRCHGFVNPFLAKQTGFDEDDLELFWKSLEQMFELDRSASRGQMSARALMVFEHESALGNAPAHRLFDRVRVEATTDGDPARGFEDYALEVDESELPSGVRVDRRF